MSSRYISSLGPRVAHGATSSLRTTPVPHNRIFTRNLAGPGFCDGAKEVNARMERRRAIAQGAESTPYERASLANSPVRRDGLKNGEYEDEFTAVRNAILEGSEAIGTSTKFWEKIRLRIEEFGDPADIFILKWRVNNITDVPHIKRIECLNPLPRFMRTEAYKQAAAMKEATQKAADKEINPNIITTPAPGLYSPIELVEELERIEAQKSVETDALRASGGLKLQTYYAPTPESIAYEKSCTVAPKEAASKQAASPPTLPKAALEMVNELERIEAKKLAETETLRAQGAFKLKPTSAAQPVAQTQDNHSKPEPSKDTQSLQMSKRADKPVTTRNISKPESKPATKGRVPLDRPPMNLPMFLGGGGPYFPNYPNGRFIKTGQFAKQDRASSHAGLLLPLGFVMGALGLNFYSDAKAVDHLKNHRAKKVTKENAPVRGEVLM